jgi:hypothetical protein
MAQRFGRVRGQGMPGRHWGGAMKYSVFSGVLPELSAEEVCARLAGHG